MFSNGKKPTSDEQWRVMARLGARDEYGIKRAMKKYKVNSIEELIAVLEHQNPKKMPGEELYNAFGRMVGGQDYDPHKREINQVFRRKKHDYTELDERKRRILEK
jgi:hypothetical protein